MNYTSLVSAQETSQHLQDSSWRIIDCRFDLKNPQLGLEKYKAGHIPGATYADLNKDLSSPITSTSGRHPLPDIATINQKLGSWGIRADTQVVVYDDAYGSYAARLWWILRWLGHQNVAVLDGGITHWQQLGLPLTTEIPSIAEAEFITKANNNLISDTTSMEKAVNNPDLTIIDVRDPERFQGIKEPIDKIAGHVPGAINIPWKTNLDKTGLFLEPVKLATHYEVILKSRNSRNLVFMCGSGVTACHGLLAMAVIGHDDPRLYPGSWSEWIQNPDHPVESGATEFPSG